VVRPVRRQSEVLLHDLPSDLALAELPLQARIELGFGLLRHAFGLIGEG